MDVAVRRGRPPVTEQAFGHMQAFAVHDRVRGMGMTEIVKPRIGHDPGHVARGDPEIVKLMLAQRPVPLAAGEHPLTRRRSGKAVQQLPRRLAEQDMPRPRLRVGQGQAVGFDLAPAQAAYLARPASRQQEQAHRRDAGRAFGFALAQDRAKLRQVVRAEQPPARRTAVADDAGARIAGGFGPMAPCDGAIEHAAQDVVGAVRPARLPASVFVEEAGGVGAHHRADAQMAESGQDGAVEIAHGGLDGGRLPRRRAPLDIFGGERLEGRAGSGKGHRSPAALLAGEEGERGGARLAGLHRVGLAERDPARRAVAAEAEHPGPRAVGLDAQPLAAADRDRRMAVTEIVNAQRRQPRRRADRVPCLVHRRRLIAGRRKHPRAIGAPLLRGEHGAGRRRQPERARPGLRVRQHRAVAVDMLPLEPQRLGLARAGVEQEAERGDGDRPFRLRPVERPTERGELVVRQVVRLEAGLAPPQSLARVGVLAPQSERLGVLHHRGQHRQRPVRRSRPRDRQIVEPVVHVFRGQRIDAATAERGQDVPAHAVRVRIPRRGLPAFRTVGEEHRREVAHRRDRYRCAVRFRVGEHRPRRVPCVLDRQRVERTERPPDDRAARAPMHVLRPFARTRSPIGKS